MKDSESDALPPLLAHDERALCVQRRLKSNTG